MNGLRALFLLWCAALACAAPGGTDSFCAGVFPERVKTVGVCMPASVMDRAKFDARLPAD